MLGADGKVLIDLLEQTFIIITLFLHFPNWLFMIFS
jgi:hypothetical protein